MTEVYDKIKGHAVTQSDAEPPFGSMFPRIAATETDLHLMAQELAGKRTAQSDAEPDEDKPIGFRTNDVPDPYAEGPQSAAEPYCSKNINAESEWLKGYYIPIGGTRPGPGAGHSIDPSKPGPDDLAQSDAESFEYCPICGKDEDHEHGNADVDAWLKTQSDAEPGAMK